MTYRPRSLRDKQGTSFDVQHEGLPQWLLEPARNWLSPFIFIFDGFSGHPDIRTEYLRALQARMHLDPPLPWQDVSIAAANLLNRMETDNGEVGLDILDYALHHLTETRDAWVADDDAKRLELLLKDGTSAWEVTPIGGGNYALTRRALGPTAAAIEQIRPVADRAGAHLYEAWKFLAGRSPLPDQAYFQALQAVEAAAKPVVIPNDDGATLGKMIAAMRDKPSKWTFALGEATDVADAAEVLWTAHVRHGTDDRSAPMEMTQEQADAGVHLALTLTRWFVGGALAVAKK